MCHSLQYSTGKCYILDITIERLGRAAGFYRFIFGYVLASQQLLTPNNRLLRRCHRVAPLVHGRAGSFRDDACLCSLGLLHIPSPDADACACRRGLFPRVRRALLSKVHLFARTETKGGAQAAEAACGATALFSGSSTHAAGEACSVTASLPTRRTSGVEVVCA